MVKRSLAGFAMAWLMLAATVCAAAEIAVRTDRDPVSIHESFQIEFEATGSVDDDPDFGPLTRDFNILSTAQSTSFNFINGRASSSKTWTLTVVARRTGKLAIPPVAFGRDRSPAADVTVLAKASAGASRDSGDIFMEVEAHPLKPLVQAQVIYTTRLFIGVPVTDASLSDPKVETGDAVIERLGEDRNYETQVMGRKFKVLERNYSVFPQSSGKVVLAPLTFQGRIGRDVFSLFDPFGPQPRAVVRQSAPVTLDVQPIPGGFAAPHWLPAKNVQLSEEWSPNPPEFRVGDPVTRTIVLSADGLSASQLPDFATPYPDTMRAYPDQPVLDNRATPAGIIGSRQEKVAIIPSAGGDYVLPEISVPWWNTATGELEYARLPERRFSVQPQPDGAIPDSAAAQPAGIAPGRQAEAPAPVPGQRSGPSVWIWLCGFLAAGWLVTALLWMRQRSAGGGTKQRRERVESGRRAARAVIQSCNADDPRRLRDALLRWAAVHWPAAPPRSIGDLAARCNGALAAELRQLNAVLYARTAGEWNGNALKREFERAAPRAEQHLAGEQTALEPLFRL